MPTPIEIANNKLLTCQQTLYELRWQIIEAQAVILDLRADASMALDRTWNKDDEGFEDQLTLTSTYFNKYKS